MKKVEYNTIASSFGCISDRVQNFHEKMLDYFYEEEYLKTINLPNEDMIIEAFVEAFKLYNNHE